jgi:hypothetical protein
MNYLIQENQKLNARKWNIFINEDLMKYDFNSFLEDLILKFKKIERCFLTLKKMKKLNCQNCQNNKIIFISKEIALCENDQTYLGDKEGIYCSYFENKGE